MSPIHSDGASPNDELTGDDSGFDDFLTSFLPTDALKKKEPSEGKPESKDKTDEQHEEKTESPEESDESPDDKEEEERSDEDAEEGEEETKGDKRKYADDEGTYVKVTVDGKEHEVPVKDLKRLWGQEAALTHKSQQVADQRKTVDAEISKNTAATQALLQRAKARFEPYSKVDFLLAAQKLAPEEYTALRDEATKAYEDIQFLEQHLGSYMQHIEQANQTSLRDRAAATLKELSSEDATKGIEGWSEKVYDEMRTYATTRLGVPQDIMNTIVDGWAIRVLHKAMLYDKGKTNVVTTKVNKTPKKIVKTTTTPAASKSSSGSKAMKKLSQTGSQDDAQDAFLERWANLDD